MALSICPIGTNGAFSLKGFNTNYIVEGPGGRFLFDCGVTAAIGLDRLGLSLTTFGDVYLSHLHLDHVGGLIQLGLTRYNAGLDRVRIYANRDLAGKLWPLFLSGFMGRALGRDGTPEKFTLEDFFELVVIPDPDQGTMIAGIHCTPIPGSHTAMSDCHGLVLNGRVFITSDTTFQPEMLERVANSFPLEAIFHHCTYNDALAGMHATVGQLSSLPADLRELIILSHYDDHMIGREDPNFELAEPGKVYRYE